MHFIGAKQSNSMISMEFENQADKPGLSPAQEHLLQIGMCLLYYLLEFLANNLQGNLTKTFDIAL